MSNEYIKKRVKEYFESEDKANQEIMDQIRFQILSMESDQLDTYILAKKLPKELYLDLISYFDGDCIRLPTVENLIYTELLAPIYFLRKYENRSWADIRNILDISIEDERYKPSILNKQLNKIDEHLKTVTKAALTKYIYGAGRTEHTSET